MAENNLIMTIAIVLAATLFFSGTLTGEATRRSDFATYPQVTAAGSDFAPCTPHKFTEILPNREAVIIKVEKDCSERIVEYCPEYGTITEKPFITKYVSYGVSEVRCSERRPDSSMKAPTIIGGGF